MNNQAKGNFLSSIFVYLASVFYSIIYAGSSCGEDYGKDYMSLFLAISCFGLGIWHTVSAIKANKN